MWWRRPFPWSCKVGWGRIGPGETRLTVQPTALFARRSTPCLPRQRLNTGNGVGGASHIWTNQCSRSYDGRFYLNQALPKSLKGPRKEREGQWNCFFRPDRAGLGSLKLAVKQKNARLEDASIYVWDVWRECWGSGPCSHGHLQGGRQPGHSDWWSCSSILAKVKVLVTLLNKPAGSLRTGYSWGFEFEIPPTSMTGCRLQQKGDDIETVS